MSPRRSHTNHGYYSGRLLSFLEDHLEGFTNLSRSDRLKMAHLFETVYHNRYPHKLCEGYSYIPQSYYRSLFGRKDNSDLFNTYLDKYDWFIVEENYRFYSDDNYTKAYKLSKKTKLLIDSYINNLLNLNPPPTSLVSPNGNNIHKLPSNSIRSADCKRNKAKCQANVQSAVKINAQAVYEALVYVKHLLDSRQLDHQALPFSNKYSSYFNQMSPERIKYSFSQLLSFYDLSFTDPLVNGHIPQCYVESSAGRLYARGVNLQNTVREVRRIALTNLKYKEYDFSNCHFNVLNQLAQSAGVKSKAIEEYLAHKDAVRQEVAYKLSIDVQQIKQCLLSLIYGARAILWSENTIPQLIGLKKAKLLFNDPFFRSLKHDIENASVAVISQADKRGSRIYNQMRKSIKADKKGSKLLAHLLQGYEAKMLNIVLEMFGEKIVVLQHDGWISKLDIDTSELQEKIKQTLNIEMPIELKVDYSVL